VIPVSHCVRCKRIGQTYVVAREVVDGGLGEHGVVLELALAEGRGVGRDDDQLGLARAQSLHGRLGTQGDLTGLHHQGEPGVDLEF
jgi:hypothetical protein